jgi:hypothetical protein
LIPAGEYDVCVRLLDPTELCPAVLEEVQKAVVETPPSLQTMKTQEEIISALVSLFSIPSKDRVVQAESEALTQQLQQYNQGALTPSYSISTVANIKKLKTNLQLSVDVLIAQTAGAHTRILALANKASEDPVAESVRNIRILRGAYSPLEIDELVRLFYQRDVRKIYERNSVLTTPEIFVLFDQIQEYLLIETHLAHLIRVRDRVNTISRERSGG